MLSAMADLANFSLPAFVGGLFVCLFAAREVGYLVGRWHFRRFASKDDGIGLIVGSILALLAFVLGFNLSMASNRLEERRADTLESANAAGTAALRARAVGGPEGEAIADLMREFVESQIDYLRADQGSEEIGAALRRIDRVQQETWAHVTKLIRSRPDTVTTSLMNAVNEAFDAATAMRFGMVSAVPRQFVLLLLLMNLVAMAVVGFQFGQSGHPHRLMGAGLAILWVFVMTAILDIGSARMGVIRATTSAFEWTLESMAEP